MDIKIIQTGPSRTSGDCTTYFKAKFEKIQRCNSLCIGFLKKDQVNGET